MHLDAESKGKRNSIYANLDVKFKALVENIQGLTLLLI